MKLNLKKNVYMLVKIIKLLMSLNMWNNQLCYLPSAWGNEEIIDPYPWALSNSSNKGAATNL